MKLNKYFLLLLSGFFFSIASAEVQNSSAMLMDRLERLEGIDPRKYAQRQYDEILDALVRSEGKIRVVSFNMLYNIYDKKLEEKNRWVSRLPRVVELIREMNADIIGAQELFQDQVNDLLSLIGEEYAFFAAPMYTIKSKKSREISGIFFRKERFQEIEKKVSYLSMTPDVISADPYDSDCRTVAILKLKDLKTGKKMVFFNTHLAFLSADSRDFSARLITRQAESFMPQTAVFVMGDMNTFPNRPDLKTLPFYDGEYIHRIFTSGSLRDAKDRSLLGHVGPIATFTNEGEDPAPFKGFGTPGVILDHIYVSPKVKVLLHAVEAAKVDGEFPSDHMPVLVDCLIE